MYENTSASTLELEAEGCCFAAVEKNFLQWAGVNIFSQNSGYSRPTIINKSVH